MKKLTLAVACLLGAAACNSTTRLETTGARSLRDAPANAATNAGETAGTATAGTTGGVAAPRQAGTRSGGRRGTGPDAQASTDATVPGGAGVDLSAWGPPSQGVEADKIRIGLRVYDQRGLQAFAAAYGIKGEVPDPVAVARAVIDDVNRRGGMGGRQVDPVYDTVDAIRSATQTEAVNQESCTALTEDAQVFAIASPMPGNVGTFSACVADHNTILVTDPFTYLDDGKFRDQLGYLYLPGTASSTRFSSFWMAGLARQGFFDQGHSYGLVWYDDPEGVYRRTVEEAIKPAMARYGASVSAESVLSNYTDQQQYASAVFRMRSKQISHVIVIDVSSLISLFFMTNAETQSYRPAYGLNSTSAFSFLETNIPDAQLTSAVGVAWLPAWDIVSDPPLGAPEQRCLDVLHQAGVQASGPFGLGIAFWTCDDVWFIEGVLDQTPVPNPTAFRAVVEALGSSYQPVGTFGATFGPGRYDGANAARDIRYDTGCACFHYTSDAYPTG